MASSLRQNIGAYDKLRADLELDHFGEWVVLYDEEVVGTYDSFETAATDAIVRFDRGPYLIRRVGASAPTLPASLPIRGLGV